MLPAILVLFLGFMNCTNKPKPPKNPKDLEILARKIEAKVEPGFVLRRDSTNSDIWQELKELGAYGAHVSPDTSSIVFYMTGFPRNYRYFYLIQEPDHDWERKIKRLELTQVDENWYWRNCRFGRRYNVSASC